MDITNNKLLHSYCGLLNKCHSSGLQISNLNGMWIAPVKCTHTCSLCKSGLWLHRTTDTQLHHHFHITVSCVATFVAWNSKPSPPGYFAGIRSSIWSHQTSTKCLLQRIFFHLMSPTCIWEFGASSFFCHSARKIWLTKNPEPVRSLPPLRCCGFNLLQKVFQLKPCWPPSRSATCTDSHPDWESGRLYSDSRGFVCKKNKINLTKNKWCWS